MGINCCPDREFVANSDLEKGILFTTVEYPRGNRLELFCEYAYRNCLSKLKEIAPNIANDHYQFYKSEIDKMNEFLSKNSEVGLNKLVVYKIYLSGSKDVESQKVCSIDFYFNAECIRNGSGVKEIMKYNYNWRKKNLFGTGEPKQEVIFLDEESNLFEKSS